MFPLMGAGVSQLLHAVLPTSLIEAPSGTKAAAEYRSWFFILFLSLFPLFHEQRDCQKSNLVWTMDVAQFANQT